MARYLFRRVLLFLPTILGATFIVFMLMALSPISITDALLPPGGEIRPGERAVKEAYIEERYGLAAPAPLQYLRWLNNISPVGFGKWDKDDPKVLAAKVEEAGRRDVPRSELAAQGITGREADKLVRKIDVGPNAGAPRLSRPTIKKPELGYSYIQSRPVWEMISEALPVTLTIQAIALPTAITIALLSGIWAARHRGGFWDIGLGTFLLGLSSLPVIWVGVMFIGFLANVEYIHGFPAAGLHSVTAGSMSFFPKFREAGFQPGYLLDSLWHLVLPVVCVSYGTMAYYSKLTRTSLLETLSSDFVRTARAKGLPEKVVLFRHALRTSLIPLITVAASFLPLLVSGSIVVETIFSINGMGRLVIESLYRNDRELFLSVSLTILILQLIGYLLADIAYVVADPRVSYDSEASSSGPVPAGYEPASTPPQVTARRTLLQQTLRDTFTRPGARIGMTWIGILATVGVFAPFLANSAPLLLKEKATGIISSPLLKTLRASDVTLAALYCAALLMLLWGKFSLGRSVLLILGAGLIAFIPSFFLIKSQDAPVYEQWRVREAEGAYQWVVRTIVPYSPNDRMNDNPAIKLQAPSKTHWLGTSIFGEDALSRMMYACRVALTIGLISTGIAVSIGVTIGGLMGYFVGVFDLLAMRCIEILEAIPRLILLLIVTVFFGRSLYLMMTVIGLIGWTADARFIRAEFLRLRNLDFVAAAKALGLPLRSIIFKHMLPNGIAPVLVNASFSVAGAILLESTLSFLGLGLGAEDPSWGQLLNQARSGGTGFNWWIATFPGVAIFLTVFSYVLIGEAMRDALDPKLRKRE